MDNILIGIGGFALVAAFVLMWSVLGGSSDSENYKPRLETKTITPMPEVKPPKRSHHKKKV